MVYALADRGARLLIERDGVTFANVEWSRKNREAGRPFIEHQIEIVNFSVALQRGARERPDAVLMAASEMNAASPQSAPRAQASFPLRAKLSQRGVTREIGIVPDLVFGLRLADGRRRNFMVEIDRGTMPIVRSDIEQTSFARKMRVYLTAHAAKQHEHQFGWDNFRVVTITTNRLRIDSMIDALRKIRVARSVGAGLFWFSTFDELRADDPLVHEWRSGDGRAVGLI
jgi:hypothetical protein